MQRPSLTSTFLLITLILLGPPKPVTPTTWLLFFFIPFVCVLVLFLADYWKKILLARPVLLGIIFLFFVIFPGISLMIATHDVPTTRNDGLTQTEAALYFLSQGKNPYTEDFRDIGFGNDQMIPIFGSQEDAMQNYSHYVYPPLYLAVSYPVYILSRNLFDFYDQRIILLFSAVLFFVALLLLIPHGKKELAIALIFFNPAFLQSLNGGMTELAPLAALGVTLVLLQQKKWMWASGMLAAVVGLKHSFLIVVPFFLLLLMIQYAKKRGSSTIHFRDATILVPFAVILLAIFLPALAWSGMDLVDDLIGFPAGLLPTSHPISGYGFSQLFPYFAIARHSDAVPLWVFQVLVVIPIIVIFVRNLLRHPSISAACEYAAIAMLVSSFFLRYMHFNYFMPVISLLLIAFFLRKRHHDSVT